MTGILVRAGVIMGLTVVASAGASAENVRKLSGAQIRARLAGMQLTDEVHYRLVYERDGTLRSYSMGTKKVGKWSVEKDELCLRLGDNDDGCYTVTLRGERFEMAPSGVGLAFDGIVRPADKN